MSTATPFAHATIFYPLKGPRDLTAFSEDQGWRAGPWPTPASDARIVDANERRGRFTNPLPIDMLLAEDRRRWRETAQDLGNRVNMRCAEVVTAPTFAAHAPDAYGLVHLELQPGPRGGVAAAVERLAHLSRPRRQLAADAAAVFVPLELHDTARAFTACLTPGTERAPLVGEPLPGERPGLRWLACLSELPKETMPAGSAIADDAVVVHPDLLLPCTSTVLAVVRPGGYRDFVGQFRSSVVDSVLLALVQRDQVRGISMEHGGRHSNRRLGSAVARFRHHWWWQDVSDAPLVAAALRGVQSAAAVPQLMQQFVDEVGDARSERRPRASFVLSSVAAIAAVLAVVVITVQRPGGS